MIIVTGGAGFIGSNFILRWLEKFDEDILNIDNLSYAADLNNLKDIEHNLNYSFKKLNIQNQDKSRFKNEHGAKARTPLCKKGIFERSGFA